MQFNVEQRRAIEHEQGPLLVVAGPGSGKTTVIVNRAARLLQRGLVESERLIVVTFARKAAEEMRKRAQKLLAASNIRVDNAQFTTVHSFAYRLCRQYGLTPHVMGVSQRVSLLRRVLHELELYEKSDPQTLQELLGEMSYIRSNRFTLTKEDDYEPRVLERAAFAEVMVRYQKLKKQLERCDFDDLLEQALSLMQTRKEIRRDVQRTYQYVIVDEAQDTSKLEFELLQIVAAPENNIALVGDDDQAIYSFRGGTPTTMLEFPNRYPQATVVTLNCNYRSPHKLVTFSHNVIRHNKQRFPKQIIAVPERPAVIRYLRPADEFEQVRQIVEFARENKVFQSKGNMAVIYRNNIQAVPLIDALVDHKLPFVLLPENSRSLFDQPMLQDMISFLRLLCNPLQPEINDLVRLLNKPTRYIRRSAVEQAVRNFHNDRAAFASFWEMLLRNEVFSTRELEAVRSFQALVLRIDRETRHASDYEKLDVMLAAERFGYARYLHELANDDSARAAAYVRQFCLLQTLARKNDFVDRIYRIRQAVAEATSTYDREGGIRPGIVLTTCHSAKGLEWPCVWIIDCVDGVIPNITIQAKDAYGDLEEERRLFYVAATRARQCLMLSAPQQYGGAAARPSRFLQEGELFSVEPRVARDEEDLRPRVSKRGGQVGKHRVRERKRVKNGNAAEIMHPIEKSTELQPGLHIVHRYFRETYIEDIDLERGWMIVRSVERSTETYVLHIETCIEQRLIGYTRT